MEVQISVCEIPSMPPHFFGLRVSTDFEFVICQLPIAYCLLPVARCQLPVESKLPSLSILSIQEFISLVTICNLQIS
jgi:hypothetical protein